MNRYPLMNDIEFHNDDLSAEAKSLFNYHPEILNNFQLYRRSILSNDLLTSVGRRLLFFRIDQLFKSGKRVLNYVAGHPEILDCPLPSMGPLIICGLPRTGSTLLYNLMNCDPNCRAPLLTDIFVDPGRPIARNDQAEHHRRSVELQSIHRWREEIAARKMNISFSHPFFPIDEDSMIMQHLGLIIPLGFMIPLDHTDVEDWIYDENNKEFFYNYHDTFLRMLNRSDAPSSHWLLKSPEHCLYLNTLIKRYPTSTLIMTHPCLDEVIPSYCRLVWEFNGIHFDENNPTARTTLTMRARRHIDRMIKRILAFRTSDKHAKHSIIDVSYSDLILNPIGVVRRIYDQLGLRWSNEFETAMVQWLKDNPQGKQGRHTYSLSDYGLERESIERRYADYIDFFLKRTTNT